MDIAKTATEWTRAEVLSSAFFIVFALAFLLSSLGFLQMGRTDIARAYVVPMLVAGGLLLALGGGLFVQSQVKLAGLAAAYDASASGFVASEIARAERGLNNYRVAVVYLFPAIIAACALLIPFLASPVWRAGLITTIAMLAIILVIDTNANGRLEAYRQQLTLAAT